ncbi:hypothetical protein DDT91_03715 [Algoriphagus sp. AK58]|nr:hypothetical protein [Algoriphagus sp. AK58]
MLKIKKSTFLSDKNCQTFQRLDNSLVFRIVQDRKGLTILSFHEWKLLIGYIYRSPKKLMIWKHLRIFFVRILTILLHFN